MILNNKLGGELNMIGGGFLLQGIQKFGGGGGKFGGGGVAC